MVGPSEAGFSLATKGASPHGSVASQPRPPARESYDHDGEEEHEARRLLVHEAGLRVPYLAVAAQIPTTATAATSPSIA